MALLNLRALVLAALAPLAAAAALDDDSAPVRRVADLRLVAGRADEFRFHGDQTDTGSRVGGAFYGSVVDGFDGDVTGLLLGGEVSRVAASSDATDIAVYLATAHVGLAWQTDVRPLHLELDGFFGAGKGTTESDLSGGVDDSGMAWEYGGRLALIWTFALGPQLGVEARWERVHTVAHVGIERVGADAVGVGWDGFVGWRF